MKDVHGINHEHIDVFINEHAHHDDDGKVHLDDFLEVAHAEHDYDADGTVILTKA